jgi:hypothetical protein
MTLAQFRLGWITIAHTCSFWRHVTLEYCALWTHHRFNLGLEWTTEMLRRAGGAPLKPFSEQVVPYPPSEENVENVILQLLHRMSSLTIDEKACSSAVLDTLTLPATLMSSLIISTSRLAVLPRSLFGDAVPNLHSPLSNAWPTWTSLALTCLKCLSITIDHHTVMSNMPSYTDLFNALQTMHDPDRLYSFRSLPIREKGPASETSVPPSQMPCARFSPSPAASQTSTRDHGEGHMHR